MSARSLKFCTEKPDLVRGVYVCHRIVKQSGYVTLLYADMICSGCDLWRWVTAYETYTQLHKYVPSAALCM